MNRNSRSWIFQSGSGTSAILCLMLTISGGLALTKPTLAQTRIRVDGSSTVFPISEAMAEEFQILNPGVFVTVGVSGTGGGFKKLCRGATHIANASRRIKDGERKACAENGVSYIELPIAIDAITIVVHPRNSWAAELSVAELSKIWDSTSQGTVTSWAQVRADFPDVPLNLYGPGVDSGTFDYFVEAVLESGGASRGDFSASEDDNVLVQGVAGDENALGYFGLAYYVENAGRLQSVAVRDNEGSVAVKPSVEAARSGTYQPLSRELYFYVSVEAANRIPVLAKFVEFQLNASSAPALVNDVGYVPLPLERYAESLSRFRNR